MLELPQSSVAVQVRLIVLSCGQGPATVLSLKLKVGVPSQLSLPVGLPVVAGSVLAVHSMVIFDGQVMEGATLSSTTITCKQVLVFPQSSVAVQVRLIVLSCGHAPATVASRKVNAGLPSQLSVPVGLPVLAGSVLAVHWIVTLGGQLIDGA